MFPKYPKKTKTKKRKSIHEKSAKELIPIVDRPFSELIRLKYSDDNGYCRCVTCGSVHFWKDIDCGHFQPRARIATRFDERNCRPQCTRCNYYRHGEPDIFREKLIEIYGLEVVIEIEKTASYGGSFCAYQLIQMNDEFKILVKQLKMEKGL